MVCLTTKSVFRNRIRPGMSLVAALAILAQKARKMPFYQGFYPPVDEAGTAQTRYNHMVVTAPHHTVLNRTR